MDAVAVSREFPVALNPPDASARTAPFQNVRDQRPRGRSRPAPDERVRPEYIRTHRDAVMGREVVQREDGWGRAPEPSLCGLINFTGEAEPGVMSQSLLPECSPRGLYLVSHLVKHGIGFCIGHFHPEVVLAATL